MALIVVAMTHGCQTWSLTNALAKKKKKKKKEKKLETNQRAMEKKTINVKLKDRTRNTIIRQRARVTDIASCIIDAK